jgi:DNA-binding transcriptional MerR regulator
MAKVKEKNEAKQIPPKLYRIGEIIKYTSFSRQTIHNYTVMGLIHEAEWTEGGHRLYDESIFSTLSKIAQFKKAGKTLKEIQQLLCRGQKTENRKQSSDF